MLTNIFTYATKELSQDAFICWLLANYDTKEIAQGENYKQIWEVFPYFSFIDEVVKRMIQHSIKRESTI